MKAPVVTVIAGGWSVANVPLDRLPGFVIAVNDAATFAPDWHAGLSMDRLWMENRIDVISRRVAVLGADRVFYARENALQNLETWPQFWPFIRPFRCDHESDVFTTTPGQLNGTNSGLVALNLAWQLNPRRLYLLGYDMNRSRTGQAYWYPPYPWARAGAGATSDGKYARWAKQFNDAASAFKLAGCEVVNVSPTSAIASFRKMTPAEFLKETT